MQRSDITGRPIVPAASRRPWQLDERRVLLLLFHLWNLTQDQVRDIFHAIFPHRQDYGTPKLRDQHNQRWSGGRRERDWRLLDRPNTYNGTPYTNQEYLDFANAVADIDREATNLNIPLTLQAPPTHQYLTHVPAGTAGIPAGPIAQQAQAASVAGPATAPPIIAPQTQAQAAVIPGTARKAPAQVPVSIPGDAGEQSDDDANSSYHESESDVTDVEAEHESDEDYESDDGANNAQDNELDVVDVDENDESDRSTNNNDPQATVGNAENGEDEPFSQEQDRERNRHRSNSSSPEDQTAAPTTTDTPPYPPHLDNSTNVEDAEAMIADIDDYYSDLFHREPDVRPPGPDAGSSIQEAERNAAQRLNAPLSSTTQTPPTMALNPLTNNNPDHRHMDDMHGLRMLHHKDVKFCAFGAHIIDANSIPVNPASQLYRLGGPLHLVSTHINSETKEITGKEKILVCNTTWCGICRATDWARPVPDPMTLLPEDSCMSHSDITLQLQLLRTRGRPLVHRGDMGEGELSNIFCPRIGEGQRVTPYSAAISRRAWYDVRIVLIRPEGDIVVSVMLCGEGCDKC
ncbi:hypothetical protein CKM354_001290400 [Cercospora kikuchii]|uniref:Uncharacterized protein n=1 Tax=Cercospora kikuchii TaxID=84275 RepID=A0A9P3L381_9PEZI|nr:uncharacterized protein CKM354_001290400 [Cercospora kikuchii]GIZ49887.1 hypothetical protein CKM354_001290400 [Cercospora kikuchii]